MQSRLNSYSFLLLIGLIAAIAASGSQCPALAKEPSLSSTAQPRGEFSRAMGCLYVFREVRSFGAHISDYVTVDGTPVHRITPGSSFYCELHPGDYLIGIARHKSNHLIVSIAPGQCRYVCVMLYTEEGIAPRSGVLPSDQSFDIQLVEPDYGAERVREYPLTRGKCQR